MKNFFKKNEKYILLSIYPIIVGLVIAFVIIPLNEKIKLKKEEVQKKSIDGQLEIDKLIKLPEFKNQYNYIMKNKEELDVLATDDKLVDLVKAIEGVATETGNEIEITPLTEDKRKKSESEEYYLNNFPTEDYLKFNINVSGNYDGLVNFIWKIENLNYWSDIVSLKIGKNNIMQKKETSFSTRNIFSRNQDNTDNVSKKELVLTLEVVFYLDK